MKNRIIWAVVVALAVGGIYYLATKPRTPGRYDAFATCLKNQGALFYGAFWCPHCQNQKRMFESSADLLPYIECSTPSGQGQLQLCIDKEIKGYPTWVFADGTRLSGEVPLQTLSEKTGCELPK